MCERNIMCFGRWGRGGKKSKNKWTSLKENELKEREFLKGNKGAPARGFRQDNGEVE